jgi:transposase
MRKLNMIEISEILYRWIKGLKIKEIARSLGYARNSVKKIIRHAEKLGLSKEDQVDKIDAILVTLGTQRSNPKIANNKDKISIAESLCSYDEQIKDWLTEDDITITQIRRLIAEQGLKVSDTSLRRYINSKFKAILITKSYTVPLFSDPGCEAQVDYAYVGLMMDPATGKARKTYAFIMALSYSRYRYVEFTFSQDVKSWIQSHINAFNFFGGVPKTVLLDNLKSGVIKADIYDPTINRSYAELERFYGFVVDPAKVRTPEHKGKVERSVQLIRQQLIAGRSYNNIDEANKASKVWCKEKIANEVTRTTGKKPLELFAIEQPLLQALPEGYFDIAEWQVCKVHKDHHIVFRGNFYSLPTIYIGQEVVVRAGLKTIEMYHDNKRIKSHVKLEGKGNWQTDQNDYPKAALRFLNKTSEKCLEEAKDIGEATFELTKIIVSKGSKLSLRKAQSILRLADTYGHERLESACLKAHIFESYSYKSIRDCLKKNLENVDPEVEVPLVVANTNNAYLRSASEYSRSKEVC